MEALKSIVDAVTGGGHSDESNHDLTAAEKVRDKAEHTSSHTDANTVTTNSEQAHQHHAPSLVSRNTTSTVGGADDNASMIPLGKGDHTEAPTTTSSSIADGTHNHSHATPAVSSVLSNDNTGDQSETARALVLAKLASCTQGREGMIVHLDQDKGRLTPTGADEVSRVIGSFPGIGALLDRMNVINAPDASTIHAYSHNASDPSRTVAHDASSTPAVSNSIAHGNAGDAPRDLTAEENTPIQTTTNTIGHLESNSPHGAINNEVSSLAHSGGETHHSNGLSDLQKEELGRVPDATHGTSSDDHAATGLAAGAAGATGLAGAENISSTAHTAPDGPSPAYTENVASQTASPRASRGGFAERLKQEIEDRAKASREGREYTGPGASAKVIAARDPSATVQDSPVKPAPTEATTKRTSVGHPGAAAAAPAVAATPETAAEPEGSRDETAAASVPASPVVQTRSRAGSTAGLTRNANESTESLGRSPSKSKGFGGLFRRNSKRASLPPSSTNASQVSLGNASAAPTATETKPANSAAPVPEGMGWKGKVSEPPIGANRRRTLTSGTSSGEAGVAAAAVGAVAAEEAEEAASHSADHNTSHSIEPQSSAAAAAPASTTANEIAIPAATTTSAAGLADSAGPSGHGPAHTSEAAAPTVEAGEAAAAAHDEVTPVAAEEAKPLPRSSSSGGFAAKLRQEIEERAKAARENRPYDGPGSSTTWVKARDPADPVPSPAKPFNEPSTRRSIDAPAAASAPEVSNVSAVVPPPAHAEADSAAASPLFPVRSRANSTISTNRDSYAAETSEPLTRSTSKSKGISGLFRRSSKRGTLPSASRNASQVSLGSTSGAVEPSDINHDKPSIAQAPLPEGAGWKGKVSEPPIGANRRRTLTSGTSGPEAAVAAAAAVHHVDSNDHTAQRSVDFEGSSAPRAETPTTHLQDRDHTAQRSSDFEGSSAVLAEIPAMHLQDSDHTAQRHHDFEGSAAVLPEPPVHHVDGHDHTAQRSSDFEGSAAVLPPVAVHHLDHHDHTVQRSSDFEDPTATDGARAAALAALEGRHHLPGTDANAAAPLAESTSDVVMHSNDEDLHRSDATEQRPSAFTEDFEGDNHAAPRESSENIGSRASYAGQSTESLSSPKKKGFLGGLFRRKSKRSSMPANYGSQSGSMVSLASVQSVDSTTTPAAPAGDIPAGMGWKGKVSEPPIGMNRRRTLTGGSASAETAAAAVAATEATEGHKDSTMVADEPAAHVEPEIRYDQTEDGMLPTVPEEGAIPETASYAERSADDHAHHHDDEAAAEAMSEEAEPVQAARPSGGGLAARLREEADARARAQREGKEYTGPGAANYIAPSKFASQPSEDVQHTSTEHAEPLTRYETSGTQRDSVAPTSATVPVYPQQTSATAADSAPKKKRFSFIFFRRHAKEEKAQPQYTPQPAYAERYQDNSEPDYRDEAESEHGYHDEAPHERDFPDDWSIGHIAAATPLPAPVYTPSVTAKRERIQRKRDHKAKIERERAEREANLLARQSRILDAYTGTQDFSRVPKPTFSKPFGRSHDKEMEAVQHIFKPDRATRKAEAAEDKEIARQGYTESVTSEDVPQEAEQIDNAHAHHEEVPAPAVEHQAEHSVQEQSHSPLLPPIEPAGEPLDIRAIVAQMGIDHDAVKRQRSQKKHTSKPSVTDQSVVPSAPAPIVDPSTGSVSALNNGAVDDGTVGGKATTPKRRKSTKSTTKSPKTPKLRPANIDTDITSADIQAAVANVGRTPLSSKASKAAPTSAKKVETPKSPKSPKLPSTGTTALERGASTKSKRDRRLTVGSDTPSLVSPNSPTSPTKKKAKRLSTQSHEMQEPTVTHSGPTYHIIASSQS